MRSLLSLLCTRNPRCVSTNFKAPQPSGKGVCELNDQGMAWTADKKDLEYEAGVIFTQYQNIERTYHYKSCLDIRAVIPDSLSGSYSIQPVPGGKVITVYCEMAIAGGGFTFVPRTAIRGIESQQLISPLFTNRTQVLMRIQKKDGAQPYTLVEQLPEYKQHLLGARVNNYDGYTSPKNSHMGDYLLLGILPQMLLE
ncbi:hypothetical protein OS493_007709 [Desmophyllum pertusum]|uniref:Uncharacterized protein n=1 Tax=Desmophyllum pertusum TaxID=174260 RepID=A0A9X0CLK3_9CNID|nr:hypothetical protein OS493_007709 [Desmophyllum pertusum]